MQIEFIFNAWTGCAAFVLYEHDEIMQHAGLEADWMISEQVQLDLANVGLAVFISTGVDGGFLFRGTTGDLTPIERSAVVQVENRFWLNIRGHELIFGGLEVMPTGPGGERVYVDESEFVRIPCEPGRYHVEAYRLIGAHQPDVEEALQRAGERVPAYVLRFRLFDGQEQPIPLDALPVFQPL